MFAVSVHDRQATKIALKLEDLTKVRIILKLDCIHTGAKCEPRCRNQDFQASRQLCPFKLIAAASLAASLAGQLSAIGPAESEPHKTMNGRTLPTFWERSVPLCLLFPRGTAQLRFGCTNIQWHAVSI